MIKNPLILVVDDKEVNRKILASYLIKAGYTNILYAADGFEAIKIAESKPLDLILLDLIMPEMDGYAVCGHLKKKESTMMIPIIIVSAIKEKDSKLKLLNLGADEFLSKPVDSLELIARVNSLLRVRNYLEKMKEYNLKMLENLKTAQKIQRALLPIKLPNCKNLLFDAFYQPANYIGGDYYNAYYLDQENICLYIADVRGHQLDAALLTVFLKETISSYGKKTVESKQGFSPKDCICELEHSFKEEGFPEDIFITLFIAVYNIRHRKLTYSAAGFVDFPYVYGNGPLRELVCPGSLIMSFGSAGDFSEKTTTLKPGESLLLYTDGLIEQPTKDNGQWFGTQHLRHILTNLQQNQIKKPNIKLVAHLQNFAGTDKFQDDITLLNMHLLEGDIINEC